jgi:hypothetical protein
LFSILEIDCEEVDKLKPNVCFTSKNGDYIIRQGVKLNLHNLCDALKEKHDKYKKSQRQQELSSSASASKTTTTSTGDNNNSTAQNLTRGITTDTSSSIPLFSTDVTNSTSLSSKYTSINDHANFIKDLIEKFSQKTFISTILKNDEHYQLIITQNKQKCKAVIKCQCGAKLMLPSCSEGSTFILSNFYAHLTTSTCSMVERINKQEKKTGDKESEARTLSTSDSQPSTSAFSTSISVVTNPSKRRHDHDTPPEITTSSSKKRKK